VVPNKKFNIDFNDKDACYSILVMHHPWRYNGEWLKTYATFVDAVRDIVLIGESPLATMLDHIQQMDAVIENARLQHTTGYYEEGSSDIDSKEAENFYTYNNSTLHYLFQFNTTSFTALHGYTVSVCRKIHQKTIE
jgi:hypothetical protein